MLLNNINVPTVFMLIFVINIKCSSSEPHTIHYPCLSNKTTRWPCGAPLLDEDPERLFTKRRLTAKSRAAKLGFRLVQSLCNLTGTWRYRDACQIADRYDHHYHDVIMRTMAYRITNVSIVCSGADQSSSSLAFVIGIHRFPTQRTSNAVWWRHHDYNTQFHGFESSPN